MPKGTRPPGGPGPDRRDRRSGSGGGEDTRNRGPSTPSEPIPEGAELALVQFKGHRKGYFHNRRGLEIQVGQYIQVEADRGRDMGRVLYIGPGKPEWWGQASNQGVLQVANAADLARLHDNRGDEWGFWDICQEKIQYRRLIMNLVMVERQFDHKKITFYFTAEKRVDFRELVRDLAAIFRTRIELRQIGVRDEARLKGGLGICGREFCCSNYLHEFIPVTLKMAKVQQLPLNPGKLSGPCGRLRCCMTYEHETYLDARSELPRVGSRVRTPDGPGTVRKVDLLQLQVTVQLPGQEVPGIWPAAQLGWEPNCDLPRPSSPDHKNACPGNGEDHQCGGCGRGPS